MRHVRTHPHTHRPDTDTDTDADTPTRAHLRRNELCLGHARDLGLCRRVQVAGHALHLLRQPPLSLPLVRAARVRRGAHTARVRRGAHMARVRRGGASAAAAARMCAPACRMRSLLMG